MEILYMSNRAINDNDNDNHYHNNNNNDSKTALVV